MTKQITNQDVVQEALEWVGTPYHHRTALKQKGVDCIGLILGVYAQIFNEELFPRSELPIYSPDWRDATKRDNMLILARKHFKRVPKGQEQPGDVRMFRMKHDSICKHCAFQINDFEILHAYSGHKVCIGELTKVWKLRTVETFRFKNLTEMEM